MKLKLITATVALVLAQGAFAKAAPQACPTVEQLQSVPMVMGAEDPQRPGSWVGMVPNNNYGTSEAWTFLAGPVESQGQQAALESINAKLSSLNYVMGPMQDESVPGEYVCIYMNQSSDFYGVALNPPFGMDKGMKYIRQMKK